MSDSSRQETAKKPRGRLSYFLRKHENVKSPRQTVEKDEKYTGSKLKSSYKNLYSRTANKLRTKYDFRVEYEFALEAEEEEDVFDVITSGADTIMKHNTSDDSSLGRTAKLKDIEINKLDAAEEANSDTNQ